MAHHALNQKQKNHAAVENREGHQVQDAELQADLGGQPELRATSRSSRRLRLPPARNAYRAHKLR